MRRKKEWRKAPAMGARGVAQGGARGVAQDGDSLETGPLYGKRTKS